MAFYDYPLFRPPSEAESLIVQVTLGCSHNDCTFCSMYRTKSFRTVPLAEIEHDLQVAKAQLGTTVRRVFLADGDAMCLSGRKLIDILDRVNEAFPRLQRIGIYANARDILAKSDEDLAALRERKLRIAYVGLESGDGETLGKVVKGATVDSIVQAVRRLQGCGISASVMVLIGLAGRERSQVHAQASAEAINRMEPTYTALLTYTPTPGSPLYEDIEAGRFVLPTPHGSLEEIRVFVSSLTCKTYFTCNHASNYLPLRGHLPSARESLLSLLDNALDGKLALKPEFMRGL